MQFSMLNQENFLSRLEIFYYKNWSQVFENVFFLVFLVPLSILTIARRGQGSGGPGCDIRTRRSILYRIDPEKTKSIFHSNFAFCAPYYVCIWIYFLSSTTFKIKM